MYDYLNDSVRTLYRRLCPAAIGSMLTATVASLIDTVILSYYLGPTMLSTVSLCMPVYMLLNALSMLIASGGATLYAYHLGEGEHEEAKRCFTASTLCVVVAGLILSIVGLLFTGPIVQLLGANERIFAGTYAYARVLMFFLLPLMLYSLLLFFVRCDFDPGLSLAATLVCAAANLILDILFIGPLKMGAAGAALATCLAYSAGLLTNCIHFFKKKNALRLRLRGLRLARVGRILKTGAPLSLSQFGMALTTSVFNQKIIALGGEIYVTAYAIVTQLSMIAMSLYEGVAQAAQPIFAANLGAKNYERVRRTLKTGLLLEAVVTCVCTLVYLFGAQIIAGFFSVYDGQLLQVSLSAIRTFSLAIPFTGATVLIMYYYQARERVVASITISLAHSTVLMIAGLLLLTAILGRTGIWWAWLFAESVTLIGSALFLRYNKKDRR